MSTFYAGQLDYIAKLNGMVDGSVVHTKVTIDDANFNLDIVSSNPRFTFDSSDFMEWNRASNYLMLVHPYTALASGFGALYIRSADALAADKGGTLAFGGIYTSGGSHTQYAGITGLKENATDANVAGYLAFGTRPAGGSITERVRITSTGRVGINTNNPSDLFHVVGGRSYFHAGSEVYSIGVGYNTSAGVCYIGGSNSATPDMIFSNAGGGTLFKLLNSGVIQFCGDANWDFRLSASNPTLNWDTGGDGMVYDRTNNAHQFYVGNVIVAQVTANVVQAANGCRFLAGNATDPGAVADTVYFYSIDDAAGHTIPAFVCEGTNVVATGQADSASSVRVKMRINGVTRTFLCI